MKLKSVKVVSGTESSFPGTPSFDSEVEERLTKKQLDLNSYFCANVVYALYQLANAITAH
jgi:hypothetical protein